MPLVMTIRSKPIDCPAASGAWILPNQEAFSWMTSL
jgi:hypothetical protein